MEIVPGLHRIKMPLGNRVLYQHLYTGDRHIIVDTGIKDTPVSHIKPYLTSLNIDPADLGMALITHADADHFGGNASLREMSPNIWIAAHRFDAEWISDPDVIMDGRYNQFEKQHNMSYPEEVTTTLRDMMGSAVPVDMSLNGGETIWLDKDRPLHVIHLPGHTRGHIGLHDPTYKTGVFTDAILWKGLPDLNGQIVMPPTYCHTSSYRTTIQQISQLDLEVLCLSHYDLLRGPEVIQEFISETLRFLDRAERTVLEELSEGNSWKSLKDVISYADPILGPFGDTRAELAYPISGHLSELVFRNVIETCQIDGIKHWRQPEVK
jgi:glyoxylase-like metal-dependent hydrolase (beta-lactamase superfamily II)